MPRRALSGLALCFFLSGLGSLVLEVVWTRQLRLVFGSTTLAASTILVAYMLGLGIGGLVGGRLSRRLADGVRAYGWMEVGIGAYALVVPFAFAWFPELNRAWLYALDFWPAAVTRFLLALAVLIVPTILMGATLPVLVAALTRADPRIGSLAGLLYGINTLGAVAGVFLATFTLLPGLGLTGASLFGAGLDAAVGVVALVALPRIAAARALPAAPVAEAATPGDGARASGTMALLLAAYALVGFTALVYEVAWTRALATVLGSSIYAFAAMLGAFLTGIALGSLLVRGRIDVARSPLALLAGGLAALGTLSLATTLVLPRLPDLFLRFLEANGLEPGPILVLQVALAMLVMLPPTLVLGALFPLLTLLVSRHTPDPGSAVGRVYFANTLGSATGAFCAGFVLIPQLGLRTTLALAAAVNFATAGVVLLRLPWRRPLARVAAASPIALALLLLFVPPPLDGAALTRGVFNRPDVHLDFGVRFMPLEGVSDDEMLLYRDGLNTTVSVHRKDGLVALKVNGKTDASTSLDMSTQVLLGELPLLFGPPAKKVLVIGFASGVTVGSVARHDAVERIDAVEIEPGIIEASHFFDEVNGRPLEDPRVRLIVDDGRTYLSGTRERYDVVISEPSNPWMSGVSNLFTREFFAAARGALTPEGRLLQWIHLYAMEPAALESILAALRSEFRWVYGFFHARGHADLLLLASNRPLARDDLPRWEKLPVAVREDLQRVGNFSTSDLWSLLYLLPEDVDALAAAAPVVNTDDNLFIELGAPWMLYEDTVEGNWESFVSARRGIVPLLEAVGEPLDEPTLARLALSYAGARDDTPTATAVLAQAARLGRGGDSIAAAVVAGRKIDAGRGEFALADQVASLDEAITLAPRSPGARLVRGQARLESGDHAGALEDADAVLTLAPDDARARALRGRALLGLGRVREARDEIDRLTSTEYVRHDASVWGDAVRARLAAGDDAAAVALLESTLSLRHPSWHEGWRLLAEAYQRLGREADAARARRNAQVVVANRAAQFRHDGLVALWSGDTDGAISNLSAALRIDPDDRHAQQELDKLLEPTAVR
jgi:spermidine synthase